MKGAATLFKKNYGYYDASGHNNGNVLAITDGLNSAQNQTYTYDALNRIATAAQQDNAFNIVFSIDAWGNMTESGTSNFNQNFDSTNRMHGWSYDASGDLLNDGSHSYTYDAEGRIKTVDGTGATYTYGPDGERVRKDTAAGSTEYIYFGSQMIAELNPATGAWTDYIFAAGKRIAKDTSNNGRGAQYYQGDHLGSTRIMTDALGTVISNCTYAPFGEEVSCSPDNPSNRYRFTGKERDVETGLDYFGARYYSSAMGRFTSVDPSSVSINKSNPQSWNRYNYALDNPLKYIDYNGKWPTETHDQVYVRAFPGLTHTQITAIQRGSAGVDQCIPCQGEKSAYQHAMRGPKESVAHARSTMNRFIQKNEAAARQAQTGVQAMGYKAMNEGALEGFGRAAHPVSDATSPSHEGFQVWKNPLGHPVDAMEHSDRESAITPAQMDQAVNAVRQAYGDTFGQEALQNAMDPNHEKVEEQYEQEDQELYQQRFPPPKHEPPPHEPCC